jgi:hypothetical protein
MVHAAKLAPDHYVLPGTGGDVEAVVIETLRGIVQAQGGVFVS